MAEPLIFRYGTEAQILELTPLSTEWYELGFYYPNDKDYFYQVLNGVMKKYGGGESAAVGVTINDKYMSGVKTFIASNETVEVPENFDYNTFNIAIEGTMNINGQINIS